MVEGVENFSNKVFHVEDLAASVIVDLHACVDEDEEQEGMDHYMETCNDDFSIIEKIPSNQLAHQYYFPFIGDSTSTSPSLNVHNPTCSFDTSFFPRYMIE